jgi:ATP-dependent DNA ligase
VLLDGPIAPMLCSPGRPLPAGDGCVLEPKWDGIRAIVHVTEDGPRLFTRHGRGHHRRFPRINAALAELPVGTVLAGELTCLQPLKDGRVRCRFDRVSAFMVARAPHRPDANGLTVTLIVFDALAVDGADLRGAPWRERRARLGDLLGGADGAVAPDSGARAQPRAARRPGRRRLGGHRRQAHQRALPVWASQQPLGEAEVAGDARPRPAAVPRLDRRLAVERALLLG